MNSRLSDALLLTVAVIWGTGFVAQRLGAEHLGPMTFTGARFILGAMVVAPIAFLRTPGPDVRRSPWGPGLIAGTVLFLGALLQQVGLETTTAGNGGFITGLYIVFVPIFGLLLGTKTHRNTWLGMLLAVVGLYFLSVTAQFEVNPGDIWVFGCALVWAAHVLVIDHGTNHADPLRLAAVQFMTCAVLGSAAAVIFEADQIWVVHEGVRALDTASFSAASGAIAYSGFISVGIAFTLQVVAQKHAPPAHAAILMSFEAVFALFAGIIFLNEGVTMRQGLGATIMFAGIILSQFSPQKHGRELVA